MFYTWRYLLTNVWPLRWWNRLCSVGRFVGRVASPDLPPEPLPPKTIIAFKHLIHLHLLAHPIYIINDLSKITHKNYFKMKSLSLFKNTKALQKLSAPNSTQLPWAVIYFQWEGMVCFQLSNLNAHSCSPCENDSTVSPADGLNLFNCILARTLGSA